MKAILVLALVIASVYAQSDSGKINPAGCGRRLSAFTGRRSIDEENPGKIVGGTQATARDWNWMVSLRTTSHICGASLINSMWVLTAAHCTRNRAATSFSVRLGAHNIASPESYSTTRAISSKIEHPSYNSATFSNDMSLLRMASAVTYTTEIGPICFPAQGSKYDNQMATATGWGTTSSGGQPSNVLLQVQLKVRTDTECVQEYGTGVSTTTMLCAGIKGDNKDTCQGDSGGPLVVPGANSIHYLVGVVSWGKGCGDVGVYAKVSNYVNWVSSNIY